MIDPILDRWKWSSPNFGGNLSLIFTAMTRTRTASLTTRSSLQHNRLHQQQLRNRSFPFENTSLKWKGFHIPKLFLHLIHIILCSSRTLNWPIFLWSSPFVWLIYVISLSISWYCIHSTQVFMEYSRQLWKREDHKSYPSDFTIEQSCSGLLAANPNDPKCDKT